MRPPAPTLPTKYRYPTVIVTVGLFSGILITALIWLKLPNQLITPLFWISLGLIGLGSFMYIRKLVDPRLRWIMVLAVFAAVSLVYLFPELFGPACGGMPRAFALSCPKECQVKECTKWVAGPSPQCPKPGPGGGCCLSYETVCDPNCEPPPPPDQPPSISKSLSCTNWGQNSWCIGSLTLQLTATEPQGKQVQISGDIAGTPFACPAGVGSVNCSVPLPEGAGTANYLATSITGLTASGSTTYKHDSRLPQINGWLNGTSGNNSWYVSSVDVHASASDPLPGSGLAAFVYNLDAGGWKTYSGPLSLPDGVHSLSLRASDAAGNVVETNQTIQVDTVTPALDLSVTGTAGTNGWYRSNVQVSAAVADSGSGVSAFEYDPDGAGWTAYTAPLELSDGVHSLSLRALDAAGNSTNWTQSFRLDTITPLLDMTVDGTLGTSGWYTSLVEISLVASDPGSPPLETSGLGALEYNLNGAGWAGYSVPLELSDGVYTLELRAIDVAGNVTSGTQGFQVDAAPPTLDVNVSGTQGASPWYVSIVQVEAVAGDATSNLSTLEVKVDGGDWSAYNAPLAFGDGAHSYRFRARDNAGNLTLTSLQSLLVDTIPPALSLPESWEVGEKAYFELQDNGSGLASVRLVIEDEDERYPKVTWEDALASYKFNGEINWDGRFKDGSLAPPTGEYYATLKVTDNAGNENRIAGQIKVPLLSFIETLIDSSGGLVSGTEGTDPVVTLIPDSETDEELTSQSPGESAPSTLSFGGGNNNAESSGEQSALKLGGGNNGAAQPSSAQTGKVSFNAGGQSNSPLSNAPSNLLWGATATAAIGAFAAEILRKKQEEEAKAAEKAARQESRAESTYRQKIKANKLAKLETKWAAEREQAEQLQLAEQRKQTAINPRVTAKEEAIEAEMRAYGNKPAPSTAPKQTYIVPDMSWKKGDYAQLEHAKEMIEASKQKVEKLSLNNRLEQRLIQTALALNLDRYGTELQVTGDSLRSIGDINRNPRAAETHKQMWAGISAWEAIFKMRKEAKEYTAQAIKDRRWNDAFRGISALAKQNVTVAAGTVASGGIAAWGIVTTPVRIFKQDLPEFFKAGKERLAGKDRSWDVVLTATNLIGDVTALYGGYQLAGRMNVVNKINSTAADHLGIGKIQRTYTYEGIEYIYRYNPYKKAALGYLEDIKGLPQGKYNILKDIPDEIYGKTRIQSDFLRDIANSKTKPRYFSDPRLSKKRVFSRIEHRYLTKLEGMFPDWWKNTLGTQVEPVFNGFLSQLTRR